MVFMMRRNDLWYRARFRGPLTFALRLCATALAVLAIGSAVHRVEPAQPVQWQRATLTFDGPATSEDATPNPFRDYRMAVKFRHEASGLELK